MIKVSKNLNEANLITHGGIFHADEVFATVILAKVFGDITVCRTFNVPETISNDVIVYDIGFGELDHHQKGGNGSRENEVPYASCGLIWKKYGYELLKYMPNCKFIWDMMDKELIQGIDAIDNGALPSINYPAKPLSISKMIKYLNPCWDSTDDSDEAFLKAVAFAENVFDTILDSVISKSRAQNIVENAIEESKDQIMVLDKYVPWQEFIFSSENPKADEILFVVFPSNRGGYNFQCVPIIPGSLKQKKSVPGEWKGLSGEKLQLVTGIEDATFCHLAGFIGGANSFEGAYSLAKMAVAR